MPFMNWVKTPDGYKPVEITDEEMVAQNTVKRAEREKMERIREQLEVGDMEREKMEFDKSRVFSSVNADELRAGDKVIVGNCVKQLKSRIESNIVEEIKQLFGEQEPARFDVGEDKLYALAYLVERAENCTNCGEHEDCGFVQNQSRFANLNRCEYWKPKTENNCTNCSHSCKSINPCLRYEPKTEQKAEKHYRPFRDVDELIKVWDAKIGTPNWGTDGDLTMPHIWVRQKECSKGGLLITYFGEDEVRTDMGFMTMSKLLNDYTFTDGSPCGVEE